MTQAAPTPVISVWQRYGAALRHPEYRRFWVSATVAGAGVWGLIVARGVLALRISDDSAAAVGLVTFAAMIPFVVVPPFSGILADKFDRRYLVAGAHFTNVFFAIALAWLYFYVDVAIWHLVTLSLLSGIARGIQLPASSALVPNLVPREDLLNAIALNNVSLQGSRLLGGLLVGSLLGTTWGIGGAFLLAVGMYILATIAVLSIKTPSTGVVPKGASAWEVITAGFVYAYRNRPVGLMLAFVALHCGLTMAFESVYPTHAINALGQEASAFALIIAAFGAGAVLGVVSIAGIRDDRTKGRALLVAAVGSSIAAVAMAYSTNIAFGLGAAFVTGLFQAPFMSLSIAFIQAVVPDAIRGRVSSLFTMSALSLMALANLGYGWLVDLYGSVAVLVIPAVMFFGIILAALLFVGTLRKILIEGFSAVAPELRVAPVPSGGSE
jgi:MFS family permease